MKKLLKPVALLAVLSLAAVGCQKENIVEPSTHIQQNVSVRNITYNIDGISYHCTIKSDKNWNVFIDWMISLAKEGHTVSFHNDDTHIASGFTKDVVTYVTTDEKKANEWSNKMIDNGYNVTITYDPRTGEYTCVARN
jgi:hypothetical protein